MNEALTGAYERHVDVDEIPLTSRIAQTRELELRGDLHKPVVEGSPDVQPDSRVATQPGDDPDLHIISQSLERRACLFIHPQKSFSMAWGFLTIVAVMWVVLSLPFKLAFLSERWGSVCVAAIANTGRTSAACHTVSIRETHSSLLASLWTSSSVPSELRRVAQSACTASIHPICLCSVVLNFYTGFYDANDSLVIDGRRIQVRVCVSSAPRPYRMSFPFLARMTAPLLPELVCMRRNWRASV